MKFHATALGILMAFGSFSCAGNGGANNTATSDQNAFSKPTAQAHEQAVAAANSAKTKAQQAEMPSIPKDAQYTIYCTTLTGPDHTGRIKALKAQLLQTTPLRDWYIVHGDGQSTLYYGFYREEQEARMKEDCRKVAALLSSSGDRLFLGALPVSLETADPSAPPEWNLLNAPGVYTLQIATYKDSPQRRSYAVDAVRTARAQGYEAYYYHGATASYVCIGAWPENAVLEQNEVRAENPHEVVGVVPAGLPFQGSMTTPDGRPIRIVNPKFQIKDASLLATMKQFPTHSTNGLEARQVKNPVTGKVRLDKDPSVVVKIPHKGSELGLPVAGDPGPMAQPATPGSAKQTAAPPKLLPPSSPPPGGKLKSLEDSSK